MADGDWEFLGEIPDVSADMPNLESDPSRISVNLEEPYIEQPIGDFPIEGDGNCVICGAATFRPPGLTKGGNKKRVPKFCDDHDPKNERAAERATKGSGLNGALALIQEELADDIKLFGTLAGVLYPVTGYYLIENADPFTLALIKLAKGNERFLRVLHRAASVAPIYTVAQTLAGTAVAVQVDMNKIEPHSFAAERTGVTKAYDEVYPQGKPGNFESNGYVQPPRFTTVG